MKALLERLKHIEDKIKNNSEQYDEFNLAVLKYERIILIERITQYN